MINLVAFSVEHQGLVFKQITEPEVCVLTQMIFLLFELEPALQFIGKPVLRSREHKQNMFTLFTENSMRVIRLWVLYLFTENNVKLLAIMF